MNKRTRYSPEVRERAIRLLFDHHGEYPSEWAALVFIANKIGCTPETLRKWVRRTALDQGQWVGMTTSDREQLLELKRENRELKRAHEILCKASAFFAQAQLNRRPKYLSPYIDEHQDAHAVESICKQLPISPSTYYQHKL